LRSGPPIRQADGAERSNDGSGNRGVKISFSYDVVPGVRLSVVGQPTEAVVLRNIRRLRAMGIQLSGIAVLAKHTVDRVTDVYAFYAREGMGMRILPLFAGPDERPQEDFLVEHTKMVAALERLFRHWVETGCKVPIRPLDLYLQSALRNMVGHQVPHLRRGEHGDGVLLVNVDGRVYRVGDAYEQELALGSIAQQSIGELLESQEYAARLSRVRAALRGVRVSCGLHGGIHLRHAPRL
jgi:uncharacterized protein